MTTEPRDQHELDEDGFHEIQLSGKQLVFLCMATTVVSIVIFLCGVLVGRGVRPVEPVAEAASVTSTDPMPPAPEPSAPAPSVAPAASNAPASAANKPSAAESVPQPAPDAPPPAERGTAAAAKPNLIAPVNRSVISPSSSAPAAAATSAAAKPADPEPRRPEPAKPETTTAAARPAPAPVADAPAKPASEPATPASAAPAASASSGNGAIAVQVGAMKEKGDAEALARHLSGKGYAVYIVQPAGNAQNPVYRVRVGNYTSQDEAARVKRRLEQEEKLKPWITR